jgi:hypothetical protein
MLYSVSAVLSVDSCSWHEGIESDDFTLCSAIMVAVWMTKREIGDKDETDAEDRSGYEIAWYNLPFRVGITSYWGNYTTDRDSCLLYRRCYINSNMKLCKSRFGMMI